MGGKSYWLKSLHTRNDGISLMCSVSYCIMAAMNIFIDLSHDHKTNNAKLFTE